MFLLRFFRAMLYCGPVATAASLSFLNASRFGSADTKSCSVGFLLGHFHSFGERVAKPPNFASSRLYRFCREFLWAQTRVTALMRTRCEWIENYCPAFLVKSSTEIPFFAYFLHNVTFWVNATFINVLSWLVIICIKDLMCFQFESVSIRFLGGSFSSAAYIILRSISSLNDVQWAQSISMFKKVLTPF